MSKTPVFRTIKKFKEGEISVTTQKPSCYKRKIDYSGTAEKKIKHLTDDEVTAIKVMNEKTNLTQSELACIFDVINQQSVEQ